MSSRVVATLDCLVCKQTVARLHEEPATNPNVFVNRLDPPLPAGSWCPDCQGPLTRIPVTE